MNKDTVEERRHDFSLIWSRSRYDSHVSQDYMADHMHISRKKIQNWESGITSPTMIESSEWFSILKLNPMPYYYGYLYPEYLGITGKDSDKKVTDFLLKICRHLPLSPKKQLLFILLGNHGSSPSSVFELFTAHLHMSLRYRHIHASIILQNYLVEQNLEKLICTDEIGPDIGLLQYSVNNAQKSILDNAHGYCNDNKEYRACADPFSFSDILHNSRVDAGYTQEDLAEELDISRRTVSDWETGKSSPDMFQVLEGFRFMHQDPMSYYYQYIYPDYRNVDHDQDKIITHQLLHLIPQLPITLRREILFVLYGGHGSSAVAVINLMTAHLHTTLRCRLIPANIIYDDYLIEQALDNLICPDNIHPNVDLLANAIRQAEASVYKDDDHYTTESQYRHLDRFARI